MNKLFRGFIVLAGFALAGIIVDAAIRIIPTIAANLPTVNIVSVGSKPVVAEPCQANAPTYSQISIAATGPTQIVAATSGKQTYVCHLFIAPVTAPISVALIQGTGTNCATSPTALYGGTTAATGAVLAINEGFQLGDGLATVLAPTVSSGEICITTSATTQLSGSIKTVAQ